MDYARIEQSIRRQREERGLSYVPGRHNDPEKFGLKPKHVKRGEFQKAIHNGKDRPLDHWSSGQINERRESLLGFFNSARSWDQLSRMLATEGIALKRKGQGIVLEGADGFMKLSELRKDIRLGGLEALYGEAFGDYAQRNPGVLIPTRHADRRKAATVMAPTPTRKPKPSDSTSTDDAAAPVDAAEIERLRAEAREERLARREEELARREEERKKRKGAFQSDDNGAATQTTPSPDTAKADANKPSATNNSDSPSPRGEAFDNLGKSREALDLAKRFHELGLIGDAELARAKGEVKSSEEKLDPHLSMGERLANEVGDALRTMGRTARKARPPERPEPEPPVKKRKRPKFKRKDRDERER